MGTTYWAPRVTVERGFAALFPTRGEFQHHLFYFPFFGDEQFERAVRAGVRQRVGQPGVTKQIGRMAEGIFLPGVVNNSPALIVVEHFPVPVPHKRVEGFYPSAERLVSGGVN